MNYEVFIKAKDFCQIRDGIKPFYISKDLGKIKPGDSVILTVDGVPVRLIKEVSCVDHVEEYIVLGFKASLTTVTQYGENAVNIRNAGNITFNL